MEISGRICARCGVLPLDHDRRNGTREGYLTPEFTVEVEALVRGIYAIADRCPPKRQMG